MGKGRLEAEIKINSAAICTFNGNATNEDLILTLNDLFYISSAKSTANDFLAEMMAQINDAPGLGASADTITATMGADGRITISSNSPTFGITWTNTAIRDMLGFTGNQTGSTSYTSTNACQAVWIPSGQWTAIQGDKSGWWEFDDQELESPGGLVFTLHGEKKKINEVTWGAETRAKTWAENETITNESYESFLLNAVRVGKAWATGKIRWYPDETNDAVYYTYKLLKGSQYKPTPIKQNWIGGWAITLPRLVRDPTE